MNEALTAKRKSPMAAPGLLMTDIGKLPPQATDLEMAVLGAILISTGSIDEVIEFLKPEMFYKESHQIIYRAALQLHQLREPIDILTITNQLRKTEQLANVGGPYYIITLTQNIASAANIVYHARIVYEKYIGRELISIANETAYKAYEEVTDCFDLADEAGARIKALQDGAANGNIDIAELASIEEAIVRDAINRRAEGKFVGISSGLVDIDKITGGWQKSELIILGARPGMGKTRLSLSKFAKHPAKNGIPVAFYSLEMSKEQVIRILCCSECGIDPDDLKTGRLSGEQFTKYREALGRVAQLPIHITAKGKLTISELEGSAKRLQRDKGIKLIIVDYLQKITATGCAKNSNRTAEVDYIASGLKTIANELNIPVIAIASMSREVERRGGAKKPQLSDLRESGNIESDADMVMFLYRPSYYGIDQDEGGNDVSMQVEVLFEKNRNGKLSTEVIMRNEYFTDFYDFYSGNEAPGSITPNTNFYETDREFP